MSSSTDPREGTRCCGYTDYLDILREQPLLSGVPLDVIKVLAYLAAPESLPVGEALCEQGDPMREEPMVFRPGQFYGFAALVGCLAYPFLRQELALAPLTAALITIVLTFLLRVLAISRNWRTTPVCATGLFHRRRTPPVA